MGPLVFRISPDGIFLPPADKFQLHKGGRLGVGVFGPEEIRLASITAAGLAVEGEADGVKNGGLTGTGVAGDEVQALGPQGIHVQNARPGIGTEGRDGQL